MKSKNSSEKKYYTAEEILNMVKKDKVLPCTSNQKGFKVTFVAKARGTIFGEKNARRYSHR